MHAPHGRARTGGEDQETRQRLLDAAIQLFAEHGFKKVTVRDLCHRARANVAAVNYHFGDKFGLYLEVFRIGQNDMQRTNDAAREAGEGKPPEEKLRAFLHVFLQRLAGKDRQSWMQRMMMHEMADPTPALDMVVEQAIRPRIDYLSGIVSELLGCPLADPRVLRCVASVQGQCFIYFWAPVRDRVLDLKLTASEIEKLVDHTLDFSLAGIRALAAAPRVEHGRASRSHR
jgi:AcrR family transcriptional regulator